MGKFNRLAELDFEFALPDVIWGTIPITEKEREIIQQPFFTRLLDVKQMGVASVAFPGAIHHRYQHSIGVMYVADQLLGLFKVIHFSKGEMYLGELSDINSDIRQGLRIAALLHDIGHPPLSHVIEEALRKNPELLEGDDIQSDDFVSELMRGRHYSHENATQYLIKNGAIQQLLQDRLPGFVVEQIALLAVGKANAYPFTLLNPIINGDLDADKIDYLRRDAHHCGFLPTYNLTDFDGVVRIEIEKGNPRPTETPRIYVQPSALGVANAFLHLRYREIDEFHHDSNARIATQIIVNDIAGLLGEMPLQERPKLIQNLHLHYRDSELLEVFSRNKETAKRFDEIRRGQVGYQEVYSRKDGKETLLDFSEFTPTTRLHLHTILSYPPAIAETQRLIRQALSNDHLIVDIRTAKPPRFSLVVDLGATYRPTIFGVSATAKGLLRDSITNLKVHFYLPSGSDSEIDKSKVTDCLRRAAIWSSDQHVVQNGSLFGHYFTLIIVQAILEHSKLHFGKNATWLYGQWHLQHILKRVSDEVGIQCPYPRLVNRIADADFVRDIETLITTGILQERAIAVPIPSGDRKSFTYVFRHDFSNTIHAMNFSQTTLSKHVTPICNAIRDVVCEIQDNELAQLGDFIELEDEEKLIESRVNPIESDVHSSNRRQQIRGGILGKACLVIV